MGLSKATVMVSAQNSMVLSQRQTYTSMEQNTETINICTQLQTIYNRRGNNIQWRKDTVFNMFLGNLTAICTNNEIRILSHT